MSNLYNPETPGGSLVWWMGQVVDDSTWRDNTIPKNHADPEKPGFGQRYKVRIFGKQRSEKVVPDEQLPMAEVLYPVTAGSGLGGSRQTANIKQGDYVVGFYKDGMDQTEPIIWGLFGTGAQTDLFQGDPTTGFVMRSGYKGLSGDKPVSYKDVRVDGKPREGTDDPTLGPLSNTTQQDDGKKTFSVDNPCEEKNSDTKGIQTTIKNLLKTIQSIQKATTQVTNAISTATTSIQNELNKATELIAQFLKNIISKIRGYVMLKVTNAIKDTAPLLFPNERPKLQDATEVGTNGLSCVFDKIIDGLLELVGDLLSQLIDKYINAPLCAVEKFLGDVISSVLGQVTDGINTVMNSINAIMGTVTEVTGSIMNVLNIVSNILKFFLCDSERECPGYDEWSFWDGTIFSESPSAALGSALDKVMGDFGAAAPPCNTNSVPCGPPTLSINGGGGFGATGNLIVAASGQILGADLTSFGLGYTSNPTLSVEDSCGNGNGAVIEPIMEPTPAAAPSLVSAGSSGGTPLSAGGSGGIPVTINNVPLSAGGSGGTPVTTTNGSPVTTSDGTPVTAGANGGAPVTSGATGGTPIVVGNSTVSAGGTGGTPVVAGASSGFGPATGIGTTSLASVYSLGPGPSIVAGTQAVVENTGGNSVVGVVVVDSGYGYLSSPDGSTGGNGSTFSGPSDTIVTSSNGNISSYASGVTLSLNAGDSIGTPLGTQTTVYDSQGNIVQQIIGGGQLKPTTISSSGSITTPNTDGLNLTLPSGLYVSKETTYSVLLRLVGVRILDGGIGYSKTDKISVTPSFGAELEPEFNDLGVLTKVNVIQEGSGFADMPEITMNSETGYNAKMVPIFRITRLEDEGTQIPDGAEIVRVVDCVGRV